MQVLSSLLVENEPADILFCDEDGNDENNKLILIKTCYGKGEGARGGWGAVFTSCELPN